MDLTEALLNRYTNSVVSILNAVRGPDPPTARLGRPAVSVSRSRKAPRSSRLRRRRDRHPARSRGTDADPERRARETRARPVSRPASTPDFRAHLEPPTLSSLPRA